MCLHDLDLTDVDYTYDWYRTLLQSLLDAGYEFRGFEDAQLSGGEVLLRHDVDWSPQAAAEMAEIEADNDVTSTYFFLITSPFYNAFSSESRRSIERIESLGHDVGLHFAVGEFWTDDPGDDPMSELIDKHHDVIGVIAADPTDAVAFHNPPEWTLDRTYDGFVSTYEPRFFGEITYEADSLHRWRTEPPFKNGVGDNAQVLVHPTLWGEEDKEPATHIRRRQKQFLAETDAQMQDRSRLDWEALELREP